MNLVKTENKKQKELFDYGVAFASAILIITGTFSPIFSIAAFLLNIIYAYFSSPEKIFYQLFFLLAFANVFKLSPTSTSLFTYLELFVIAKIIFFEKKIKRNFFVAWLILFIYILIGSQSDFTIVIKQALIPLIIYCFCNVARPDLKKIAYFTLMGLFISGIIALNVELFPSISNYIRFEKVYDANLDDIYRFSGLYSDPNYYSLMLLISTSCMLLISLYTKNVKFKIKLILCMVIVAFLGAKTVSKSFILMFGIVFVLYVILLFKNKKYILGIVASLLVVTIVVLILYNKIPIFENVIARLKEGTDITTGRADIWKQYISFFKDDSIKILFGNGLGQGYLNGNAAHNTYIDFLYYYGIFGSIVFVTNCLMAIPKITNIKIDNFYLIFVVTIMLYFLSAIMYFDFAFTLAISLYLLTLDLNNKFNYDK